MPEGIFIQIYRGRQCCAAFGGHPHQSKNGSFEPLFDSFSLKGEAFGQNLRFLR